MSPRVIPARAEHRAERVRLQPVKGCMLVIFGATGDLSRKKLLPALYRLDREGYLEECFGILGLAREEETDEGFREAMRAGVADAVGEDFDPEAWRKFARRLHYFAADLKDREGYGDLSGRLEELGAGDPRSGNQLFYFAVPPALMDDIVAGLAAARLTEQGRGWTRIVVEKPFGEDLESARRLNRQIARWFTEDQVYRIDHFLGKETVQNILAFRFGNTLFEPVWNRNYIDRVEITAAETLGIGERASFYEKTGALRDVLGNHLLQLLTLTAMEPPVAYEPDAIRAEKAKVLRSIPPLGPEEVRARTARGQFGPGEIGGRPVPGYREIDGVEPDSMTETYAAVEFGIANWRWAGVPFYLRTGKRLARDVTEIAVRFKPTPHTIFVREEGRVAPNVVTLRLKPDQGIGVTFSAKVPGQGMKTARVKMQFDYERTFDVELPEAYETLLLDALNGDPTHFLHADEVEAQWALVDPIHDAWAADPPRDFPNYAAGSEGPEAAERLVARNGHAWRSILED